MRKFQRLLSVILVCCLVIGILPMARAVNEDANSVRWDGSSVETVLENDGLYSVSTAAELAWIAQQVNQGNTFDGKRINLCSDIDLNSQVWTSIGSTTYPFAGLFNGNGYAIEGLNARNGLFGCLSGRDVSISNLRINNAVVNQSSYRYTGILVGQINLQEGNNVTIENCFVGGAVSVLINNVGGIAGVVNITGQSSLMLNRVEIEATITSEIKTNGGTVCVGGLIGKIDDTERNGIIQISECKVNSSISGEAYLGTTFSHTGGLIGEFTGNSLLIEQCAVLGQLNSWAYVVHCGGFIGKADYNVLNIRDSMVHASLTSNRSQAAVGGFIGASSCNSSVEFSSITNCYVTGSTAATLAGGFITSNISSTECIPISYSYFDMEAMGIPEATRKVCSLGFLTTIWVNSPLCTTSTGLSTSDMKNESSYIGWDFDTIWEMGDSGYPELRVLDTGFGFDPSEDYFCNIQVLDSVTFQPINGVRIAEKNNNLMISYTARDGVASVVQKHAKFASSVKLVVSKSGYQNFICAYSDLQAAGSFSPTPTNCIYLTPSDATADDKVEQKGYVQQHITFMQYKYPSLYASDGFYNNVWQSEDGKRLWACKTWNIIGSLGQVASLKFDNLSILVDYYDLFLSDLILDLTENELNDRVLTKATGHFQKIYSETTSNLATNIAIIIDGDILHQKALEELFDEYKITTKSWKDAIDIDLLGSDIEKLLSGKEYEMNMSTQVICKYLFGRVDEDDSMFSALFDGIFEGFNDVNTLLSLYTDEVDLITDVADAYILARSCKEVNQEVFKVLYDTADEMETINVQYANWFRKNLNTFSSIAMDDAAMVLYILKEASFDLANTMYDRILRDTVKKVTYKFCADILGMSVTEFKIAVAFYNGTYKLLDLVTRNGEVTEQYEIMNYIAPVEKALSNVVWQYGINCNNSQSYVDAQRFDLAYDLLCKTNKYLYDAAYNFSRYRYNLDGTKPDDLRYATYYKNLWNTTKCHNSIVNSNSKYISIQCPVDVYLYDSFGNIVLSIVDESVTTFLDDDITVMICDETKAIMYPADSDYSIKIVSRNEGTMDYEVVEAESTEPMRVVDFYNLELTGGKEYTGNIPCEINVQDSAYALVTDGSIISCDYDSNSTAAADCNVNGHTFGEWITIAVPTYDSIGQKEHFCSICGLTEKEGIPRIVDAVITGVTVAKNLIYDNAPKQGYIGSPTSSYTGDYEITYAGRNSTEYNSTTPPIDAGDYTVTIKIPDTDETHTGSISMDFSIAKAEQTAPISLELESKTSTSVMLKAITPNANGATVEYSRDGVNDWQSSPIFTGLTVNTEYSFAARYVETENYKPSPTSTSLKVTTERAPVGEKSEQDAPSAPELESKTSTSVTLKAIAPNANGTAAEYSRDGGKTWQSSPTFTSLTANTEYSFVARYAETENYKPSPASTALKVTIETAPVGEKSEQAAPSAPELESKTSTSVLLKAIAPNTNGAAVEYSRDGGKTWQPSPTFTSLTANTEYSFVARYAETENYKPSQSSSILKIITDKGSSGSGAPDSGSSGNDDEGGSGSGHNSTNSSSSGYSVSIGSASHGKVTASPSSASTGQKVTLTIKPDSGYKLDRLTVKDKKDDEVELKKVSDTKYTFIMPSGRVTITPTFTKAEQSIPANHFADVPADAYYANAVAWAVEQGITAGTSATTFSPDATCTRAQMVTFLWRAAGSPTPKGASHPFIDINSGEYYYDAVLWAVEQGITAGTSAATFSPNDTVTRSQTVTFLHRAAGIPSAGNETSFVDVDSDAYYAKAVQWAVEQNITAGTGATTFSPSDSCTRAQIVTFLYRANN